MEIDPKNAVLAWFLVCAGPSAFAAENPALSERIDAVFASIDSQRQPGCAAGVIHNGEYIHRSGYGLANLEHNIPITAQSVFRTGSVSKQFTAMAIAVKFHFAP